MEVAFFFFFGRLLCFVLKKKSFSVHRSGYTAFSSNYHETLATSLNSSISFSSSGKWEDSHGTYRVLERKKRVNT